MIQLSDIKPCADYSNAVQAEGVIVEKYFALDHLQQLLQKRGFIVFSLGEPRVLVCKRSDSVLLVHSNATITITRVSSQQKLLEIICEIETGLKED